MNGKAGLWLGSLCAALACFGISVAEDSRPAVEKTPAAESARRTCINQCEMANGTCNSEVRQARQECSRKAANSGRDPMTMRNSDYTYFCSYFRNSGGRRGPGNFTDRFVQHYNVCIDVMQQNIASMRYDCHRNERDAQSICRTELRECQAACQ
jgi:hypothetical protein